MYNKTASSTTTIKIMQNLDVAVSRGTISPDTYSVTGALAHILVESMRTEFRNNFRYEYDNYIGLSTGTSESLFRDRTHQGGPPRKRMRYGTDERFYAFAKVSRLVTSAYRIEVLFRPGGISNLHALINKIQRWWRHYRNTRATSNQTEDQGTRGFIRTNGKNVICPITLEPVSRGMSVKLKCGKNAVVAYDIRNLMEYLRSTRNFKCPLTRVPFTIDNVGYITMTALTRSIPAKDIMTLFSHWGTDLLEAQERNNAVLGLRRTCEEIMEECVQMVMNEENDMSTVRIAIDYQKLPEWSSHVTIMSRMHPFSASVAMRNEHSRISRLHTTQAPTLRRDQLDLLQYLTNYIARKMDSVPIASPFRQLQFSSAPPHSNPPVSPIILADATDLAVATANLFRNVFGLNPNTDSRE
jgi:hypothetical protein